MSKVCNSIKSIKTVLFERPWGKINEFYNRILLFGIIFKGLQDFLDIINLTNDKKWIYEHKTIEEVWNKMLNCKDHFVFTKDYLTKEFIEFVLSNLNRLEKVFEHNYGSSLYMSAELIYKPICNICSNDIRICEHVENRIYNGKMCKKIRDDSRIESYSVVEQPFDYRCRIWPWNVDKKKNTKEQINTTFTALIYSNFSVDAFLFDD